MSLATETAISFLGISNGPRYMQFHNGVCAKMLTKAFFITIKN